jgi:prepilin-type N-terminal cleavage/methylation domain-containing protein
MLMKALIKKERHGLFLSNNQIGLSLIEVLIAVSIFSIGMLAIAALVIASVKNTTSGHMLTQATMLARERIEYLKTLPLDQLADACSDANQPQIIHNISRRSCETDPLGISTSIHTLKVTVTWRKLGQNRQVILESTTRGLGS